MSKQNIEALRAVYEASEGGDLRAGQHLLDAEIESVWPPEFPSGGTYRPPGHARAMREWLSPWEDFTVAAEGFFGRRRSRRRAVSRTCTGRGSGIEVERRWAHLRTMRTGKAVRVEVYIDPANALDAVGGSRRCRGRTWTSPARSP
jgi:ketosteroid isomerase-like protein